VLQEAAGLLPDRSRDALDPRGAGQGHQEVPRQYHRTGAFGWNSHQDTTIVRAHTVVTSDIAAAAARSTI
jgi:hypothetical protein